MGTPARILVVDNDPVVGQTFARMLRVSGFQVEVTQSVDEALSAARTATPDAMLTDLRMPTADGLTLLGRLRADAALCEVPVAVISGDHFLTEDFLTQVRSYGASVRFKPLFLHDLLALVNGLLPQDKIRT